MTWPFGIGVSRVGQWPRSISSAPSRSAMAATPVIFMQSIELKVGQSSIKLDQMGVTIKGMTIKIEGQIQVEVKGLMTQVNGDAMLTLKGGITMIN